LIKNKKDRKTHYHIILSDYCDRSCPYCINSSDQNEIISKDDYDLILKELKKVITTDDLQKIVIEFNGGEFTLIKNIEWYFERLSFIFQDLSKSDLKKIQIILTTNFIAENIIYNNIYDHLRSFLDHDQIWFWVSTHYDYTEENYIQKLKDFLSYHKIKNNKINYWFNTLTVSKKHNKYINDLRKIAKEKLKELFDFHNIIFSTSNLIPVSSLKKNIYWYDTKPKLCSGNIYLIMYKGVSNYCKEEFFSFNEIFKRYEQDNQGNRSILCKKSCTDQKFDEELFKPKYLKK